MMSLNNTKTMKEILAVLSITEYYQVSDFIQLNLNQQQLHYRITAATINHSVDRFKLTEEWANLTRFQPC